MNANVEGRGGIIMKVAVLGTGMIGGTVVKELTNHPSIECIYVVDGVQESIDRCIDKAGSSHVIGKIAVINGKDDMYQVLTEIEADIAVACLPHALSLPTIEAAIDATCHIVDLVGSLFEEKKALHKKAEEAGVLIVPGCGVAPGITNFLAARGVELLDETDEVVMICGGIPKDPLPPLWYQIVFRLESLMGLYTRPALAAENGELVHLKPLSGLEQMTFPEPVGACEAVITDAHSTAYTLKDKAKKVYEKTVRYKGHWEKMGVLAELGFFSEEKIDVEGTLISPMKMTEKIVEPHLRGDSNKDITALRVTAEGKKDGRRLTHIWEMVDHYDEMRDITSMAKTTAMPAVLVAERIINGEIQNTGVIPVEEIIIGEQFDPFIKDLQKKGIHISYRTDE